MTTDLLLIQTGGKKELIERGKGLARQKVFCRGNSDGAPLVENSEAGSIKSRQKLLEM